MNFELKILSHSLETTFTYKRRTIPLFRNLLISIIVIFVIPKSETDELFILKILLVFALIIYFIFKFNYQEEQLKIEDYFIGKLKFSQDRLIIEIKDQQTVVDKNFKGEIIFKFEGYHEEYQGYSRNPNIYYGTINAIILNHKSKTQSFNIFLSNKHEQRQFHESINWAYQKKLNFKEFTRGERTYLGQKLNFAQIQEFNNQK